MFVLIGGLRSYVFEQRRQDAAVASKLVGERDVRRRQAFEV